MITPELSLRVKQEVKTEFLSQSKCHNRHDIFVLPKPVYFFTRHVAPNQSRRPKVHIVHLEKIEK